MNTETSASSSSSSSSSSASGTEQQPYLPDELFAGNLSIFDDCVSTGEVVPEPSAVSKQVTGDSTSSTVSSLWATDMSQVVLTPNQVMQLFAQSALQLQAASKNIDALQAYACRIENNLTVVKKDVNSLRADLSDKYQHLEAKQTSMAEKLENIHEQQSAWATELSSSSVSRVVVAFLMKHAFNTAEGQVAAFPFYSVCDGDCKDPELLIGVHVPLLNFMFRSLYGKTYTPKFLNNGIFRLVMQRLFEQRTQLHPDDYDYLNGLAPVKQANKDTKKAGSSNWVVFTARRFFEVVVWMKKQLDKGKHEVPLHSFENLPRDVSSPPIPLPKRCPATAAVTTPTRMAFGVPAWQECLNTKAWCKFMLLMKEAMMLYLPHSDRPVAENFYNQAPIPPLRLLKTWCCFRLKTPVATYEEVRATIKPVEGGEEAPRTRAGKRPRKQQQQQQAAGASSDEEEEEEEEDEPQNKRARQA